jgi:hypothetical protein
MMPNIQRGVVYIATGEKYVRAAIRSARSVRQHCPDLLIHLFADLNPDKFIESVPSPFNSWAQVENPHARSKVDYIYRSPYDETLFLDSDTEVVVDIREVFTLLEKYDMALAHDVIRNTPKDSWKRNFPPSFPEFNAGVILYRKNASVTGLLKAWQEAYHEAGFFMDQITLRELLWRTDLKVAILPPEYNTIMLKYPWVWRKGEAIPKILHFRKYHEGPFWLFCALNRVIHRFFHRMQGNATFLVSE